MNESIYQLYKAGRDMVEQLRHKDVCQATRDFVDTTERISNNLDKLNTIYYERWKKERNENNASLV